MKIAVTLLMFLGLLFPDAFAQAHTKWGLPDGAVARLGRGCYQGGAVFSGRVAACCCQFDRYLALQYNDISRGCDARRA